MRRIIMGMVVLAAAVSAAGAVQEAARESAGEEGTSAARQEHREEEVSLDELPAAARRAILREAGGHQILEVERIVHRGRTFFEAEWREGGREVEVTVTPEGEVIGREAEEEDAEEDEEKAQ